MPNSGYFDKPFAIDGTRATVPDTVQSDGSVSYDQGYGVDYTLPNTNPSYKYMEQDKFNQLFFDITRALQNWQQNTIAPFITSSMNGGSPYSYSKYNMVLSGGVGYISLSNTNTDTPPSANWAVINLTGNAFYSGGVTTGSAANQVLATVTPAGFSLTDGYTVACTAGFNCPGACNVAIAGAANTAIKIWNGSSYVDPATNQFLLDETIFLSVNATHGIYVLTDAPTLGTAASKAASDNSKSTLASVSGSFTTGHLIGAADTAGTSKDLGFSITKGSPVTLTNPADGTSTSGAHGLASIPTDCTAYLQCTTAQGGFSVNDRILLGGSCLGIFGTDPVYTITADATNITIGINNIGNIEVSDKVSQTNLVITPTSWQLVVVPYVWG